MGKIKGGLFFGLAVLFYLASYPTLSFAQREPELQQELIQEKQEEQKEEAKRLIELLRQRALQRIKAEKARPKPKVWKVDLALISGFENNVNLDSFRKGDYSIEEDFTFTLSPKITHWLSYSIGYSLRNTHYLEQRDNDTFNSGLISSLLWKPTQNIRWDIIGFDYELNEYTENSSSTFEDRRLSSKLRHTINENLYQRLSYTHSRRDYKTRRARDGLKRPSDPALGGLILREDDRHTISYEIGGTFKGLRLKLKQDYYFHTSNDAYQDYYDATDYKVKPSITKTWLDDKLATTAGFSFERKNYEERLPSDRGYAQFDDIYEGTLNAYYTLDKYVTFGYTFKYKWLDSNDPGSEYSNLTNQIAMYVSF